ncbi:DUF2975 domain-containing protein [Spirosoma aureum]|uniref:DUF2975 domain-containing protein n=1 Tax=Spirosoma aureum TaxID=2692134 RepID=A0A6G9AMX2_9BACT|nr:DUF2975 domain-containing protein [Spirosoma aureum]QIP13768.1 DUF2975 domain-containing protein [Spirosoma aureum]
MEKNSASWVFPVVKGLVSFFYYFLVVALLIFILACLLKVQGTQLKNFTFQTKYVTLGKEPAGYVSVPVAWGSDDTKTVTESGQPPIFLQQKRGQLQVPLLSKPGILVMLLGFVGLITTVWTFGLLRQIFITVQTQSPFQAANARRITTMGFLFLGQTLVEVALKLALVFQTRPFIKQLPSNYQDHISVDMNLDGPWLLGLILLALAQIYRRGIAFQLESELTV